MLRVNVLGKGIYLSLRFSKKSTSYHQEIVDLPTNFHTALTKVIAKMRSVTALLEQRNKSLHAGRQARKEKTSDPNETPCES
jgi:hypothetical protein